MCRFSRVSQFLGDIQTGLVLSLSASKGFCGGKNIARGLSGALKVRGRKTGSEVVVLLQMRKGDPDWVMV